jgi:hypothetical protein
MLVLRFGTETDGNGETRVQLPYISVDLYKQHKFFFL